MRLLGGGETAYNLSCGGSLFPTTDTKFQVTCRMKGGWVQAEDLYVIIIFFLESIVKDIMENPLNLAENPLENPGKEFHIIVGHPACVQKCSSQLQIPFML